MDSSLVNVRVLQVVVVDGVVLHHRDTLLDLYDEDIVCNRLAVLYQQW